MNPLRRPCGYVAFLLFALASVVVGCGKPGSQRVVTFAAALLPSEQTAYKKILSDFTAETGIAVHLVAQQYVQIREAVEAEARAGQGELDVVELDVYLLPAMSQYMLPLDTLGLHLDGLRACVAAAAWRVAQPDSFGPVLFLPHRLNWQALFYDSRALQTPPATWDELLQVAKAYPGAIGLKCAFYEGFVCDVFSFIWQAGGDVLHPTSPATVRAVTFLLSLVPYLNPAVQSYKENTILQAQEHAEILLHPNWPFAVPLLRAKGLLPSRIRTAPLPRGPAGLATVLGGGYVGIPRTAPHPRLAARLLHFLTYRPVQRQFLLSLGWFPMRKDAWTRLPDSLRQLYSGFLAMRQAVRARPAIRAYPQISRIWQEGMQAVLFSRQDPKLVLRGMQAKIDTLLAHVGP